MTIFTVLKYPLSDTPTKEEFRALPTDLIYRWIFHPNFVSRSTSKRWRITDENVVLLRKIMQEWEG